jgi:DNA-binding NtrC family response regulator
MPEEMGEEISDGGGQAREESARTATSLILIIDDDSAVRNLLRETLELRGYQIVVAATVQEADEALQRLAATSIGLVITDIHLTRGSHAQEGYELYQRWTALHPTLHFLLISGDPSSRNLPAVRSGIVRFLAKPFTINELLEAVRTLYRL